MFWTAFASANDVPDTAIIPANINPAVSAFFMICISPFTFLYVTSAVRLLCPFREALCDVAEAGYAARDGAAEAGYAARDGAAAAGCAVRGADDLSIRAGAAEGCAARGAEDL